MRTFAGVALIAIPLLGMMCLAFGPGPTILGILLTLMVGTGFHLLDS